MLHICLVEPEIPQNTGNIARTAAVTGSNLVLVHPLGFDISEKAVRRSGLDYWKDVEKTEFPSSRDFFSFLEDKEYYLFSSHATTLFTDAEYPEDKDIWLVFGKESEGLGEEIVSRHRERALRIPMRSGQRSLNLSNSVAIAVYEVLRRHGWKELEENNG